MPQHRERLSFLRNKVTVMWVAFFGLVAAVLALPLV